MRDIRVAAAQFEHRDGKKGENLDRIRLLTSRAVEQGAEFVAFHECCITGYTVLQHLDRGALRAWAEPVPEGPSVDRLSALAGEFGVYLGAGLLELGADGEVYNCYAVVGPDGLVARHRKLNDFISPHIRNGSDYTTADLGGVRFGFLTCYDNNLPENVRVTTLMGAEVVVMPHVTGCTPSTMPGRGPVDPALWEARDRDPVRLRQEFDGPKGRAWLMKWLPARCWENGVYAVFANPVGRDHETIKPGLAMVLDPHGEVLAECRALGDDVAVALLTREGFEQASGRRYVAARRPELYGKLVEPPPPGADRTTKPGWRLAFEGGEDRP